MAKELPEQSICLPENVGFSLLIDSVALMNHSCCPNVIVTYKGTLAEVRAVQEIHPGEEVSMWLRVAVAVGTVLGSSGFRIRPVAWSPHFLLPLGAPHVHL